MRVPHPTLSPAITSLYRVCLFPVCVNPGLTTEQLSIRPSGLPLVTDRGRIDSFVCPSWLGQGDASNGNGVLTMPAPASVAARAKADLSCGSGRARLRKTGEVVEGSALVAATEVIRRRNPYREVIIGDLAPSMSRPAKPA